MKLVEVKEKQKWQEELSSVIADVEKIDNFVKSEENLLDPDSIFPFKLPANLLNRVETNAIEDPILRQFLPLKMEKEEVLGFVPKPLQEEQFNPIPGVLHKYPDRVLVMLTGACAVHCRYCFRRNFPYQENVLGKKNWQHMLAYIAKNEQIQEVILSGGDPLTVSDAMLAEFISALETIPHLTRLRFHTRTPIVLPSRITDDFVTMLSHARFTKIMVLHVNHPNELSADVATAIKKLKRANIILLNQSVLLNKVNANVDILATLSHKLFELTILPYYLHKLDPVSGSAHFAVANEDIKKIYQQLLAILPGYLVPKLVYEQPGAASKIQMQF